PRYTNNCFGVFSYCSSNNLSAFLISSICYRTSVDDIDVCHLFKIDSFIVMFLEHIPNTFRFIMIDRKSTRLNSSHVSTSYAALCLKKNNTSALCEHSKH